ncbi:NAD(P)-binding protein [Suhomyces tanzawaensis NRRL Y-17324]|uniref:NAD(P)-binding protein n=1 Tax=Suhomyces tanzawaensis NRRL Y-17324 TaxID=984487 RepID=A0A1E4SN04_9ASCO|nr:NAD(P)-binding protein [Suhomyces tanzawaensis NRRL Y-17324]ODV80901.1 NAD(P)-binding protein [Suhomyces tanzawaensis NRRL Y-17324]
MVELNVNGKVAVVTGGSRGLGLDCAEVLAVNGASTIVITSRKAKACEEAKAQIEKVAAGAGKKVKVISIPADLSDEKDTQRFFDETSKQVDKVDILIANAGASWGSPLEQHPVSAVKKVLDLNIVGVFQSIQLFTPLLEKAGTAEDPSRVLIMSSIASISPVDFAGTYGYLASKAGVTHMGKNLALQLGPRNITVNSLAPGFFPSKMSNGLLEVAGDVLIETNPRKRLGKKQDIQDLVLFMCAKQSSYINGIVIPLDGGAHLGSFSKL